MITKKTLAVYNWTSINNYYEHIIESKVNGTYSQVKSLIDDLSKGQKKEFIKHCDENEIWDKDDVDYCKDEALKQL